MLSLYLKPNNMKVVQYYYPSADEIKVGMECQVNFNVGYVHSYETLIVDTQLIQSWDFWESNCSIRVPLITKDQILKEGWVSIGGFFFEWPVKETIEVNEFSNRTLDFRLNFVNYDRYLSIDAYERNSFDWERVFAGPCPTINHLRDLMRLFNIKK